MDMVAVEHHYRAAAITATERALERSRPAAVEKARAPACACRAEDIRLLRRAADEIQRLDDENRRLRELLARIARRCDTLRRQARP